MKRLVSPYHTPPHDQKGGVDVEADKAGLPEEEEEKLVPGTPEALPVHTHKERSLGDSYSVVISGTMYILCSSGLILLNKHALSSFDFHCPNSLLCFHCLLAVLLVKATELVGLIRLEPIKWNIVKVRCF